MIVKINNNINKFINKYTPKAEKGARRFLAGMERSDILAPIILLESTVVTGRTYQAYKRDGFIEGRERFTEEILGSIFWLFGFKMFNSLGDKLGKKLLKLKNVDFDVANGNVRKPLLNFVKKHANTSEKSIAAFKCSKVLASILLSNAIIGFVVPKINQAITRQYQKSINNVNKKYDAKDKQGISFSEFKNKTNNLNNSHEKPNSKPSFGFGASEMFSIANLFENNATAQLLSNDAGTAGGRAINARNKEERREILFRDLSSIYFYMFCRHNINSLFNKFEHGKSSRLNTITTKMLHNHILNNLFSGENKKAEYSAEKFTSKLLGKKNVSIPEVFNEKFENGVMTMKEFEKTAQNNPNDITDEVLERARKMSNLQPKINGEKILTSEELLNSYKGGLINDPEFLHSVYQEHFGVKTTTKNAQGKKVPDLYKFDDEYSYISESKINNLHTLMKDYVTDISKKAFSTGKMIDINTIKKANHMNFALNLFNLGFGFVFASFFLSTAIPKIQYWITRVTTGENKFPGVTKYQDDKKIKK